MLSKERIAELKMYFTRCVQSRSLSTVVHLAECGLELIEMVEALQQENERLRAQAARMREACILGYSYLSLIFHRADIKNWNEVGMCSVKDIKHVLNELESAYKGGNTPADYHNPADVEALRKTREAIQRAKENFEPYGEYEYDVRYDLEEALAEIDKVMGGKEDE